MTTRDPRPTGQPELAHIRSRLATLLRLYAADLPAEQVDALVRVVAGLMLTGRPNAAPLEQLQGSRHQISTAPLPELLQAQLQQLAGQLAALGSQDAAPPADAASTWPLPQLCLWRSAPGDMTHYSHIGDLALLQQDADGRYRMQLEVRPGAPAEVVRAALSTDPDLRIWLDMRRVEHPASRLALALTLRHPAPIAGYRWSCSFQARPDRAHTHWQAQLLDEAGEVAGELRLQVGAAALIVLDLRVARHNSVLAAAMIAAVQLVYPEQPVQSASSIAADVCS